MSREHAEQALRQAIRDLDGLHHDKPATTKDERRRRSQLSRNICAEASLIYDNLNWSQRTLLRRGLGSEEAARLLIRHREIVQYVE